MVWLQEPVATFGARTATISDKITVNLAIHYSGTGGGAAAGEIRSSWPKP